MDVLNLVSSAVGGVLLIGLFSVMAILAFFEWLC